jgi:hypothetical protein
LSPTEVSAMTEQAVRREVEIDSKLAELWEGAAKIRQMLDSAKFSLAHKVGVKIEYETRTRRVVRTPVEELLTMAQAVIEKETTTPWAKRDTEKAVARWHELKAELAANREQAEPLEAIYAAEQWSRFFLVQNHGGHIHKDMSCSTCFPTTLFGWLPTLSGLTERDAVEEHGPLLCSVCFPSAPVEWTTGIVSEKAKCEGSGEYAQARGRRYAKCPHCDEFISVTSGGKLRAHKPKAVAA